MHVALFTRAWIEMFCKNYQPKRQEVALFTRAWIEILSVNCVKWFRSVALFTRAWIEIRIPLYRGSFCTRRPLYEGVDWNNVAWKGNRPHSSRPLYEGVDWNIISVSKCLFYFHVALFTRAWIEIESWSHVKANGTCRPLYEGVDWNGKPCNDNTIKQGRPLYEGVDWNTQVHYNIDNETSRPLYEGVDWNL